MNESYTSRWRQLLHACFHYPIFRRMNCELTSFYRMFCALFLRVFLCISCKLQGRNFQDPSTVIEMNNIYGRQSQLAVDAALQPFGLDSDVSVQAELRL